MAMVSTVGQPVMLVVSVGFVVCTFLAIVIGSSRRPN
jgi:hypothetical protein